MVLSSFLGNLGSGEIEILSYAEWVLKKQTLEQL